MIHPTKDRVLVKMLSAMNDLPNSHQLVLVDKKKHFDYKSRKGTVEAVGRNVDLVKVGDVVIFRGDAGYSLDYDPDTINQMDENTYRWLRESDCLAVEEPATEPQVLSGVAG